MQLTIDGEGISAALLLDRQLLFGLLMDLPDVLGLRRIHGPVVIARPDLSGQPDGLCGYVIIAESHITLDTYVKEGIIMASVFSCKDFNAEFVKERLALAYKLTRFNWHILSRTAGEHEET